jgi:hypothetical protein
MTLIMINNIWIYLFIFDICLGCLNIFIGYIYRKDFNTTFLYIIGTNVITASIFLIGISLGVKC